MNTTTVVRINLNDRTTKQQIGNIVATIPALVLSVKGVRQHGWLGSMRPSNSIATMRNNKVASVIYLAGITFACYQQVMRSVEQYKASELMSTDLGATDNELWAAHLADGDVTVFDRLLQSREEAITLLEAAGKGYTARDDSPYFDVVTAHKELEEMNNEQLEQLADVLNRRIMAIVGDGEEFDNEEAFLHASLVVLEEVMDQRELYAAREELIEQAKERHPSSHQHAGLRDRGTEHLTAAQRRIVSGFNSGASTTVEDLVQEQDTLVIKRLKDELAKFAVDHLLTRVDLVAVKRYDNATSTGLHLVLFHNDMDRLEFTNRTLGLFSQEDAADARNTFQALMSHYQVKDYPLHGMFHEMEDDVKANIRAQIIPVEWKAMTDDELSARVYVECGRVINPNQF